MNRGRRPFVPGEIFIERHERPCGGVTETPISYLIPSLSRPTLARTLASIELWPGDEIVVVRRTPPGGDFGHTERNEALPFLRNAWFASIDDDDWYVPGTRAHFADAIRKQPANGPVPVIFRMQFPSGRTLWKDGEPELKNGNFGTPMLLCPNIPAKLHHYGNRVCGDFDFINNSVWPRRNIMWRPEIIALLGHE